MDRLIIYPALGFLIIYIVIAYLLLPEFWVHYEHHPSLSAIQKITYTRYGIHGDPINIMIAADKEALINSMISAGWSKADNITLKSSVKTALGLMLKRKYLSAPVSDLFLYGKREDFAFEIVTDPRLRKRHHVRFWMTDKKTSNGTPLWAGAATFDKGLEFSHYTGEVTHCIAPDIDTERDSLVEGLIKSGRVEKYYQVSGIGPAISRKNGNGDLYYTDGEMSVAVLAPKTARAVSAAVKLSSPPIIETKNSLFKTFKNWLNLLNKHNKSSATVRS